MEASYPSPTIDGNLRASFDCWRIHGHLVRTREGTRLGELPDGCYSVGKDSIDGEYCVAQRLEVRRELLLEYGKLLGWVHTLTQLEPRIHHPAR
jgi:hypothetical protein